MKTVQITFAGPKSDAMAKKFFSYLVDGGLEDQLIEQLSGKDMTLQISDCNTEDLAVLFQTLETRVSRKRAGK